ncbi:MAG: hypothetical protein JO227_16090 [Acetobacteraceae bacterium]|nr:hypothetical protein [Acetobacteraceae bacterium]
MARDSLSTLLRMRRMAMDEARRSLAACQDAEDAAARHVSAMEARIWGEMAIPRLTERDAFALWLNNARAVLDSARSAFDAAQRRTASARAALSEARLAAESLERLLEERRAARIAEALRDEQRELDEVGRFQTIG